MRVRKIVRPGDIQVDEYRNVMIASRTHVAHRGTYITLLTARAVVARVGGMRRADRTPGSQT